MKRGFVLTLDVMVAIILASVLMGTIYYFVSAPKLKTDEYLYLVALDFLTVADKGGMLADALNGKPSEVNGFLYEMPDNICLNLTVTDGSGSQVFANDTGCDYPYKSAIGKRSIVNNTNTYIARMRAWYR